MYVEDHEGYRTEFYRTKMIIEDDIKCPKCGKTMHEIPDYDCDKGECPKCGKIMYELPDHDCDKKGGGVPVFYYHCEHCEISSILYPHIKYCKYSFDRKNQWRNRFVDRELMA